MNNYETVFILNPVLSETQIEETVKKFEDFLKGKGCSMVAKEDWGSKNWPTQSKIKKVDFITYLNLLDQLTLSLKFELEYRRDERVMRYLTVKLDKYAVEWAEKEEKKNKPLNYVNIRSTSKGKRR